MTAPEVGAAAPDIALPDEYGAVRRLDERRGHFTVVYFYPQDDTPGCTVEACQFRDLDAEVRGADAEVWGISPDGAASHRRFREKFGLPFVLLSDEDHSVAERYGAWQLKSLYGREYWGIVRSTFLIGPDGRVEAAWPKVKADGHASEVLGAIRAAEARRVVDA